jgi:uncharacterized C2H2 Zn-finger protein
MNVKMYECGTCGYITDRKCNLDKHKNIKVKCKPLHQDVNNDISNENINEQVIINNCNSCSKCHKSLSSQRSLKRHEMNCNGFHILQCPTCEKFFSERTAKSRHVRNGKCTPPPASPETETEKEELERLRKEVETLKVSLKGSTTINNNDNSTTNNTTNNINVIQYNNYDKPYTDHITNKVMKRIFETSQKDPALIINETVRCIYKNDEYPENHVIKIGEKTALSKVFKDGKEIWLPMDGVIQTVLSNTGDFCADRLRDCHMEGDIEGTRVVVVWKLLEVLGTDDREDDCLNRASYIQSIKSAFL